MTDGVGAIATHPVAVVGAAGYSGQELVRLVLGHPRLGLVGVFGSEASDEIPFSDRCPAFRGVVDEQIQRGTVEAIVASGAKHVFLATPHEVSANIARGLLEAGLVVLDLSAAFRLKAASAYPTFYGFEHPAIDLLAEAAYGIPEINRAAIADARLVAVAGCYPTSAILPLRPLVDSGIVAPGSNPVINSISGVSGAGRKAVEANLFCELSLRPYGVLTHRHGPEIDAYAGIGCSFVPHVAPFDRGILSTMHVGVTPGHDADSVRDALNGLYAAEPFIRVLPKGSWPSVGAVTRTNFVDIAVAFDERAGRVVICSAIDNLVKGAAGQAVQCLNVVLGVSETTGLLNSGSAAGVLA